MTSFATAEGLRTVLTRLHDLERAGHPSWRTDAEAERLMRFTIGKYQPLARAHHCQPEDSAYAAFEAMRTHAVRTADDPWAVVTRAVQVSLIAEERANGLLCSPSRARRAQVSCHRDARRFSDSEADLLKFHPAFQSSPQGWDLGTDVAEEPSTGAFQAVDMTIALFVCLGWPAETVTCAVDYIAARLIETGCRPTAHAALRRDQTARVLFDLDRRAWSTLLRLTLGNPNPDEQCTAAGHGLFVLLLVGHPIAELLADDALVREISQTAPRLVRRSQVA